MNKQEQGLTIAGKTYRSRLLVGSGKYRDLEQTREATEASGAEIITVAIRRVNIGQDPNAPSLLDVVPPTKYTILPNTAGCYNAEDAVYTLQLARELLNGHKLVKLEVLGNEKTLFPNMPETLKAAEILVKDGFDVMVYCSDDPVQAKMRTGWPFCGRPASPPHSRPDATRNPTITTISVNFSFTAAERRSLSMPGWVRHRMRPLRWNWDVMVF